ncbi:MAG: FAD-dependent monooxygenase [Muribaculaceae bacterium]|nr:FAD-dependent monooxygenase [Muribaculaceae bacterium]
MTEIINLRVRPDIAGTENLLRKECARQLSIATERIVKIDITKRSIDARQRRVMINLCLRVHIDKIDNVLVDTDKIKYCDVTSAKQVIVVGAGPAGLFAALELIELGLKPIILERGKDVDSRRADMVAINRNGTVDPDSNYCFGEGGAGAYSDGKLYTRSKKRGPVDKVLQILHQHGAQADILVDAHPHIGTDRLPSVIKAIRNTILQHGGEVHFSTKVIALLICDGKTVGVEDANGKKWDGPVILATGHSARDVYHFLTENNVELQAKGIAVGVRLEHPQHLIDKLQYHSAEGRGKFLPPAEYSMLTRIDGRAVYSFCMCPGGYIIPAASAPGQLVVNGMSPANRGTQWANSGMVVEVLPEDIPDTEGENNALKMMRFQEEIETTFFRESGHTQKAPAQRMTDFVMARKSESLPRSSYPPGLISSHIDLLLPRPIAYRLQEAFKVFNTKQPGFLTDSAILVGDETRTSSPVRIPRDSTTFEHIGISGLYPCGEGAGYAGGIVSAAIDGIMCARAVSKAISD